MGEAIQLSLAGRGVVVRLTPGTVRPAFFRFTAVNRLSAQEVHAFDLPWQRSPGFLTTPLDRLHRRGTGRRRGRPARAWQRGHGNPCAAPGAPASPYLTPFEVRAVERRMNRMLIEGGLAVVEGEGRVETGTVPGAGGAPRRAPYVIRHGLVFELEQVTRGALFAGAARDVCLEREGGVLLARYLGVAADRARGRLVARLASRFDLARAWAVPLDELPARRVFTLRRAAPWPGFHVAEWGALLQG